MESGTRRVLALVACALLGAPVATAAGAGFDDPASGDASQQFSSEGHVQRQDTPNDPDYDQAENPDPETSNLFDERYDLFGFPSKHTELSARYVVGPNALKPQVSGFNAAGAWKLTRGLGEVSVAILDTGIRWNSGGLRTQVRLNVEELPAPSETAPLDGYDVNENGVVDVDDFAGHPKLEGKPKPTGQDLIRAFSDGADDDGNGYVDDIAGWDFFDDDNDPDDSSSYFAASNHGTGRAREAVERANDGEGSLGVCPRCQFMPIRIWDTFVSDANSFALGILYATDNGASVIEGANGSLYHSAFAEAASRYAYEHGVVQTFSGDDLNTANHNYPANYGHAMLIQGAVPDTKGLGSDAGSEAAAALADIPFGTQLPVTTYFRGAGTTQFGGKSSISMEGATGSENTGKAAGAAALVISAARAAGVDLAPDETRAILEQTAEDVVQGNTGAIGIPDPAQPGWDSHFGWGRVNLGEAVRVARSGKLPPEAAIDGPDWYAPLTAGKVRVTGLARSRFSAGGAFRWELQYGLGQAPRAWTTVRSATASGTVTDFGELDLAAIRAQLASPLAVTPPDTGGPVLGPDDPFEHEFTVRLVVTADGVPTPGIDRRVLNALADDTLRPGFPKRLGTGGEAPIRYADLDGDGSQELVVPLEDGTLHAYRPDGSELPGWPVRTRLMAQATAHATAPGLAALEDVAPAREPLRAPLIADLDADGVPEVVSTAGRHVYAWNADGSVRDGFPVSVDLDRCRPEDQSQELRHRKCGFLAGPALARLDGPDAAPWIVVPALDGHVYALDGDGSMRDGFPVELVDPAIAPAEQMKAEAINQPAIGDLNGDGADDIVVPSNETYGAEPPSADDVAGLIAHGLSALLAGAAGGSSRLYAIDGRTGGFLPGWPIKLNGAIQDTLPLIGPGHDPAISMLDGERVVVASTTGSADIGIYRADGTLVRAMQQGVYGPGSNATVPGGAINLFESPVIGDVMRKGTPAIVKYGLNLTQAANLLLVGQNVPYHHLIGAWNADTGTPLPAWPRIIEDYQFLSSSTIASVDPSSTTNQVVAGSALGLLHAYDGLGGLDVPGFPKYTGGWLYAPAALSDDGRVAAITREGFLFEWAHAGVARCQPEWPSFRHDDQATGNRNKDGTAPGAPLDAKLEFLAGSSWTLTFTAPGDDGRCGTPAAYVAGAGDERYDLGAPAPAGTTVSRTVTLPESGTLVLQARDEARNLGIPARLTFQRPAGGGGSGGSTGGGGGTTTGGDGGSTGGGTTTGGSSGGGTTTGGSSGGGSTGGGTVCRDRVAPASRILRTGSRFSRRGLRLRGTSTDSGCGARVREVLVAINRAVRGGRTCRPVRSSGRLGPSRSCHRTSYIRARGTGTWRFTISRRLPRGKYTAWVRGIDAAGNVERKNRTRNFFKFTIR